MTDQTVIVNKSALLKNKRLTTKRKSPPMRNLPKDRIIGETCLMASLEKIFAAAKKSVPKSI